MMLRIHIFLQLKNVLEERVILYFELLIDNSINLLMPIFKLLFKNFSFLRDLSSNNSFYLRFKITIWATTWSCLLGGWSCLDGLSRSCSESIIWGGLRYSTLSISNLICRANSTIRTSNSILCARSLFPSLLALSIIWAFLTFTFFL
jgi:hypothetical protein